MKSIGSVRHGRMCIEAMRAERAIGGMGFSNLLLGSIDKPQKLLRNGSATDLHML